jgi:DNA-directed RNA polymerase II subunit RPB1
LVSRNLFLGFFDKVKKILECVCFSCGKLKVDESNPKFVEALRYRDPKSRLTAVWNVAKGKLVCDASPPQEDEALTKDAAATFSSHGGCGNAQPVIRKEGLKLYGSWKKSTKDLEV